MILACFVLGLSTRKAATARLPILGRRISAATVSEIAKILDTAVAAFHRRPLGDIYPVLMLDGVVLSRKTGAGALKRPVLVALGLRPDGKKEIIDWRLATAESAVQWDRFLTDLFRRGLEGKRLEMICVDGGQGLLAALLAASCAGEYSTPRQVETTKPTVTYKYVDDEGLIKANQDAATYCNQYSMASQAASFTNDQDGNKVVVFECIASAMPAADKAANFDKGAVGPLRTSLQKTWRRGWDSNPRYA